MVNLSEISHELIESNLLYGLPFPIKKDLQRSIIQEVLKSGQILESENHITTPFWIAEGVTRVKAKAPSASNLPNYEDGRLSYYLRLHDQVEWEWRDSPAAQLTQQALQSAQSLFFKMTRISVLLQIPGQPVPAHRDLVPGNTYESMRNEELTFLGDKRLPYKGESWLQDLKLPLKDGTHKKNNYMNFKLPLSESLDSGQSYIIWNDQKLTYDSKDHGFLLNEVEMEHGADPVDFYRGVIFVDGFINPEALAKLDKIPMTIKGLSDTSTVVRPL
jgi:hypothetical protein